MIACYDPIFRNLTATHSGGPELPATLRAAGIPFIEINGALPGQLEMLAVDDAGRLVIRQNLPEASRLADYTTADPDAAVPEIPELPEGGTVEPAVGAMLAPGDTFITIRAPYRLDHRFVIRRWTAEDESARLVAWATNRRWELMQLGAKWRGHTVATDDVAQGRMTAAVLAGQILPSWSAKWQFLDGSSAEVGVAEMVEIALAAQTYVNDLFTRFDAIKVEIRAGTITTEAEIEARFSSTNQDAASESAA